MKPVERLGEARAPDGTPIVLYRHDGAYMLRVGRDELMSTRRHRSEDRLAELACAPLRDVAGARVLIGGLGLGFTLKAALRALSDDAKVVVAELLGEVIAWNANPAYDLSAAALGDPRVEVVQDDVANVLAARPGAFDAILLDVDNGAAAAVTAGNARLYAARGVARTVAALKPGGTIAYWSANDDPRFADVLRRAGLAVRGRRVRAYAGGGLWHTLYVATQEPTTLPSSD